MPYLILPRLDLTWTPTLTSGWVLTGLFTGCSDLQPYSSRIFIVLQDCIHPHLIQYWCRAYLTWSNTQSNTRRECWERRDGKKLWHSTGETQSLKKFAHKICAKNSQICAKIPKIASKKDKTREKQNKNKNTQLWKITTGSSSAAFMFFPSLWAGRGSDLTIFHLIAVFSRRVFTLCHPNPNLSLTGFDFMDPPNSQCYIRTYFYCISISVSIKKILPPESLHMIFRLKFPNLDSSS